ncbi:MAG: type II toxin-antitoxin system RelE/ParE family toxin [Leptolyngbyaceae bacterium]|nr:type II toxin-antitoxin system RelE/ParE family toxin [Leptolyngbyaceae bacterium]
MKVFWTDTAIEQLTAIHAYHAQLSSEYATRLVDRITKRTQQVGAFPNSGRVLPEVNLEQIREVIELNYRIIYYVGLEQIDVLAVVHGAKNLSAN